MRAGLTVTLMVAVAILVWDEIHTKMRVPHPERFINAALVWGVLGVMAELGAPEIATLLGAGLVLTMLYTYITGTSNPVSTIVGGTATNQVDLPTPGES
jgi:hypothetical protein